MTIGLTNNLKDKEVSENITRTIYGSYLQDCAYTGIPFVMKEKSTLNEKFDIQSGISPVNGAVPKARYFAIGNGGHKFTVGNGGLSKPEPLQHRARDAALFNHLPFVLREPSNDLTQAERQRYALRKQITAPNGLTYIAYYLKRIDFTGITAEMQYKTVRDGVETTTPFTPLESDLNPTPPDLDPSGVNLPTGDYLTTSARLPLSLTQQDCQELLNVANILYGDEEFAIISEVAYVSAIDQIVQAGGSGQPSFQFNEVIAAQVCSFINTFFPVKFSNNGVNILLDVGATEPLFKLD